ncbi:MAG: hypothetical protein U9R75_08240 [Candidatus Thermoplasmatota archaeon]|nr:hypothetical protein [Candidatus Thermoplasmatota archaeon]
MGIGQRIQAVSVTHPFSMNKKIDQYLSESLPDLMNEFKIADRNDLADIEKDFLGYEQRMDALETWEKGFDAELKNARTRMDRLKLKYGSG